MMRKIVIAALFVLPVLILLPGLQDFYYLPGSVYSDIPISHYPNGLFLQRALLEDHQVPLWSPAIMSGYPFAADPLSGLYYLPGWLALPFPLPFGFNLLIVLHLIWGGIGMYLLLRAEGLEEGPAIFGALLFESTPKLFGHLAAGHLTLLYAIPWTPWLLYVQCRASGCLKPAGMPAFLRMTPGLVLGIIALADVRWAAYAGMAWVGYCLRPTITPRVLPEKSWQRAIQTMMYIAGNIIFAGLIAAPLLAPLFEFTQLSTRSSMTTADTLTQSLNPGQLFGLFFPYLRAPAEWTLYPGSVAMAFFCLSIVSPPLRRRVVFWLLLIVTALGFALGSYFPLVGLTSRLPGFDLLRVPPRALFLAELGFAALSAFALDTIFRIKTESSWLLHAQKPVNMALFGILVFVILIGVGVLFTAQSDTLRLQFGWGVLAFSIALGLIFAARSQSSTNRIFFVVFTVFGVSELAAINSIGLTSHPFSDVISEGADAASYLATREDIGLVRIYSPSYSIPQQVAGLYRLQLADGVDPLQLKTYSMFMEEASGIPFRSYSVTLPPFEHAEPSTDNRAYRPDAHRLGLLNVRYVVAEYALPNSQLRLLARFGETRVYENPFFLPRAWVQIPTVPIGSGLIDIPLIQYSSNRITIHQAVGKGLLVLSEIAYPGWQASVDGLPAELLTIDSVFRGVILEPGQHTVEFVYQPMSLKIGLGLAGLAWIYLLVIATWQVLQGRVK